MIKDFNVASLTCNAIIIVYYDALKSWLSHTFSIV